MTIERLIELCFKKAETNGIDGTLSFHEFRSFMRTLRDPADGKNNAKLVFALFDLDGNDKISKEEFREIYRYYLGNNPTEDDLNREWDEMDEEANHEVTRDGYLKWLRHTNNPVFYQHQPKIIGTRKSEINFAQHVIERDKHLDRHLLRGIKDPPAEMLAILRRQARPDSRPAWNERLNPVDVAKLNPTRRGEYKIYFSRPKSLGELQRFYDTHERFEKHARVLEKSEPPRAKTVLSTDSGLAVSLLPDRHVPGGRMRGYVSKDVIGWNDAWQQPGMMTWQRPNPGSLSLHCVARPQKWQIHGKDAALHRQVAAAAVHQARTF
jgi:hypothetical protein